MCCFSTPTASRWPASTSRSRATSTASAPRSSKSCRIPTSASKGIGDGVILTGFVSNPIEAQQAFDIATRRLGARPRVNTGGKVVNAIVVRGRDQIMLKVTVAEVERDLIKQLGINLSGSLNYGSAVVNFNNTNPFTAIRPVAERFGRHRLGWKSVSATLQAMEQAGVIHTLAEPNLTAISGETATFIAGGEFPVLNGYSCDRCDDRQRRAESASLRSPSRSSVSVSISPRSCSAKAASASRS
jgi:pilus assembly protein CpaC